MGDTTNPTGSITVTDTRVPFRSVLLQQQPTPVWRTQPQQQNQQQDGGAGAGDGDQGGSGDGVDTGAGSGGDGDDVSPDVADKGFPAKTKVADMEPTQQAAYYKWQARKHETTAKSRADYDELKAFKEAADRDKLSEHDRALLERFEAGKAEATTEALTKAATAIFRAGLVARGVEKDEIADLVDSFDPKKFIMDGDVDTDKVVRVANRVAGPVKDDVKKWTGNGQGGSRTTSTMSAAERGKAEAEKRFPKPAA